MSPILKPERFQSKDTVRHARELIGKQLILKSSDADEQTCVITETEAYDGPHDLACHASKGRTKRTEVMFGPAGCWYVYLIYGMHEMLNLVTGPPDYPAAVLIRGLEGVNGPGRLTKRLGIDRRFNASPANEKTGLYLRGASPIPDSQVDITPRIGVDYAGPDWAQRPYRFVLKNQ
ncbi:DNA-3-methyladenine glycosylase [Pelagicoccus mobilis]|uniref:Putative 3-methyladenine DNA glycosylase n=1 Tax=Pelagicoccus mobilis TaxID=415221 RepID=A0A934S0G1_9BACT|nr:DNA-3-methyladenine glycosylase [Pelagicoccus mobilis]MBK1878910.1 DNA-3-methyladenine glycosylase [Pelagicoccus mobilis]